MQKKQRNDGKIRIWVAIGLAALGIGLLMYASIRASARQYVHVDELVQNGNRFDGQRIKLSGTVVEKSASYDQENLTLEFRVKNNEGEYSGKKPEKEPTARIVFQGTKPDAFKEGGVVIVKGTYRKKGNLIKASNLQAKCPSRYKKKAKDGKRDYGEKKQSPSSGDKKERSTEPQSP